MRRNLIAILSALFVMASLHGAALCMPAAAKDITAGCVFKVSTNAAKLEKLTDGSHETSWTAAKEEGQYIQIDLPEGAQAAGVYIMWNDVPEGWSLLESAGGSVWREIDLGETERFINAWAPVTPGAVRLRIESASYRWKMSAAEIRVFGPGALPADVLVWQPSPEKADLMVVAAHPDDELIYFGGTLPYYAGQQGERTAVVYMTSSPLIRKFEALDGLWKVGVREYPVFLPLKNEYSSEIEDAADIWGGTDAVVGLLAEQFRRFKPDVVVTHDLGGEYGHGAHKLTALAVQKAVDASGKPDEYKESANLYGAWQVKKCYLHLYEKNPIEMDWQKPLPAFEGKTALEMAKKGYALHVSQHFRERPILDTGEYDNAAYGLYYSSVGPDTAGGDFFENIPPGAPTAAAEATATPAPTASPAPTGEVPVAAQSKAPAAAASGKTGRPDAVIAVAVMMLAAAGLLVVADRRALASARHAKKADGLSRRK
jgi:LmbE family N-acetylglucosaminyl deacetylase